MRQVHETGYLILNEISTACMTSCALQCLFVSGKTGPQWARASSFTRFLDHIQRHTTVSRTLLDEWSAHCRDLSL